MAMLEADMLRAGEAGRTSGVNGVGEGWVGLVFIPVLLEIEACRECVVIEGRCGWAAASTGVTCGVELAEFALAMEIGVGVDFGAMAEGP